MKRSRSGHLGFADHAQHVEEQRDQDLDGRERSAGVAGFGVADHLDNLAAHVLGHGRKLGGIADFVHRPSNLPHRNVTLVFLACGARTPACRVETHLDTSSATGQASARVPTRHAGVRAPQTLRSSRTRMQTIDKLAEMKGRFGKDAAEQTMRAARPRPACANPRSVRAHPIPRDRPIPARLSAKPRGGCSRG